MMHKYFIQLIILGWIVLGVGCKVSGEVGSATISPSHIQNVAASETPTFTVEAAGTSISLGLDQKTQTSTPTPTIYPTKEQLDIISEQITPTVTSTVNPTSSFQLEADTDLPLQNQIVAIDVENHETGDKGLVFLDTITGIYRYLWVTPPDIFVNGFSWADNGCSFFTLSKKTTGFNVDEVDLYGNLLSRSEFSTLEEDVDKLVTDISPSPTGRWIAYIVHDGERGMYYSEIQDVRIVPIDKDENVPILLSQGGWNLEPNWSRSGHMLAYTDFDDSGTPQLFTYDITDDSKHQLTDFSNTITNIELIQWSPSDEFLVFDAIHNDGTYSLWSIPTNDVQAKKADLEDLVSDRFLGWTSSGDAYVALIKTKDHDPATSYEEEVVWIDAKTGNTTNVYSLVKEQLSSNTVLPIGDGQLLLISDDDTMRLDPTSGNLDIIGKSPFRLPVTKLLPAPRIHIGPLGFGGEEICIEYQ